ncbi:MAG: AAA family ATPase, partial [Thermoanaerobaculales bacterium]
GTHQVKGKEEPLSAWRAVRVAGERGGRGRADTLEPPFVGRSAELRLLKDTLHATGRDGRARLVSLVGQAGIGKSRLVWELKKYVDGLVEDVFWHEGRSPAYGDALALWALGEMIRGRARVQETDTATVTAERLADTVAAHVVAEEADWVYDRLAALLGVGDSVGSERTELFAAVRALFEGIAARGTTVLVFEDLHWADPGLLEFIEELPDWSQNHPILVVTVARPDLVDRRPDWGSGRRGFTSLYLTPLADEEVANLIRGTVTGMPEPAVERIVGAAGGVPLFAVEMLRTLLSDGRLVLVDGVATVTGQLGEIEVPSTVQAVIAARLDWLPADERELVRDAAVLGQSFTVEGLAALRDEGVDKLERRLGGLVRHEILELNRDPRSPERGQYRWVQTVLREVAYGRISRQDRRDLHLRVARYFRAVDDPELAPVAASHFVAASEHTAGTDPELQAEMVEALRAAVRRAQALHAHEQVLSLVATALPVVPDEIVVELREAGAWAAVRLTDDGEADRHVVALRDLAAAGADSSWSHRAVALAGWVANETRRPTQALEMMTSHLDAHPDLLADCYLARVAVYLSRALMLTGDNAAAAPLADEALGAAEHFGLIEEVADAMITRGTALSGDRIHQAMALLQGALALSREHGLTASEWRALVNIGYASPDLAETMAASQEAFDSAKRVGDRAQTTFVAGNVVSHALFTLDLDAAERVLEDDPVWSDSPGNRITRLAYRIRVELYRGDRERVEALLAEATDLLSEEAEVQQKLNLERARAFVDMAGGCYRAVFELGRRHFEELPFAPGVSVELAVNGAALSGDPEQLREAEKMAQTLPEGDINTGSVRWPGIMLALVGGDTERAVGEADAFLDWLEERGLRWQLFIDLTSAVRHLPPDHEARSRYIARIRALTDEAEAPGLWEFAERALD